jgi:hypothetical protein
MKRFLDHTKRFATSIAAAAALAATAISTPATAASFVNGTVTIVEYVPGSLLVQSAGANYFGQLNTQSGCTSNNQSVDTLRAWQNLAQAALLSGKSMRIFFNTCGGVNYIAGLDLNNQ